MNFGLIVMVLLFVGLVVALIGAIIRLKATWKDPDPSKSLMWIASVGIIVVGLGVLVGGGASMFVAAGKVGKSVFNGGGDVDMSSVSGIKIPDLSIGGADVQAPAQTPAPAATSRASAAKPSTSATPGIMASQPGDQYMFPSGK